MDSSLIFLDSACQDTPRPKMGLMDIPEKPPALEFITLTDRPATQKNNFSYLVRSHAMQSVVHGRRNPTSKRPAEAETKTSKELSGKFKLDTWKKKKRRKKNDLAEKTVEQNAGKVAGDAAPFAQVSTSRTIGGVILKYGARPTSQIRYNPMESYLYLHRVAVHNSCSIIVYIFLVFCRFHLTSSAQITRLSSRTLSRSIMTMRGSPLAKQIQHSCTPLCVSWHSMKI
jgi:hypothetical protein